MVEPLNDRGKGEKSLLDEGDDSQDGGDIDDSIDDDDDDNDGTYRPDDICDGDDSAYATDEDDDHHQLSGDPGDGNGDDDIDDQRRLVGHDVEGTTSNTLAEVVIEVESPNPDVNRATKTPSIVTTGTPEHVPHDKVTGVGFLFVSLFVFCLFVCS